MNTDGFFKILDSVDSTNNYAMAKVRAGLAKHGMAFVAKEQTDGKGQRGKIWQMQPGQGLAISLILNMEILKTTNQFNLNMLIALAGRDFLKKYTQTEISIKWPNDLYWRDRKAGGILIETVFKGTDWKWTVVGIGININQTEFDKSLRNPVSLKQITGKNYDAIELADILVKLVMKRVDSVSASGINKNLKEYNRYLYKLNERVKLKKENALFTTTITGVSLKGLLQTKDTMERQFNFGEIEWVL